MAPENTEQIQHEPLNVSVIILAAGYGSRMGGRKLLLPLGLETVVGLTVKTFLKANVADIIVVLGCHVFSVQQALKFHPVRFAFNHNLQSQMMDSIHCGLRALNPNGVKSFLIMPADMPLVRPETIRRLVFDLLSQKEKSIAVPIYRERKGHPVAFNIRLYETVLNFYDPCGLRQLVYGRTDLTLLIDVNDEGVVMDIDDWDDYRQILKLVR